MRMPSSTRSGILAFFNYCISSTYNYVRHIVGTEQISVKGGVSGTAVREHQHSMSQCLDQVPQLNVQPRLLLMHIMEGSR